MKDDTINEQFLDIFWENIGIIIKFSRAYTKVEQDREDLINDIALELWNSFKHFKGNSKISTWIYRVALNVSMNYKRKRKNDSLFSSISEFKKVDKTDEATKRFDLLKISLEKYVGQFPF